MTNWKTFNDPRPYTAVIGFIFGPDGKFLAMHRSEKVRSAKNAWSLVSGLHEVGLSRETQFSIEALEEVDLRVVPDSYEFITCYEAILPEDQWHWVLHLYVCYSQDTALVNKEPEKHDVIKRASLEEISSMDPWTKGLKETIMANMPKIVEARQKLAAKYGFV